LVAIAEPRQVIRERMVQMYNLISSNVFDGWKSFLENNKKHKIEADAVVVAVQDRDHYECATTVADEGYHMVFFHY
jgi:predicted dehydrogenase